jgi:acyl CoA:acetate/3-ketoacid CoA transferase beta subunit
MNDLSDTSYTMDELICVCISRQIEDGDIVAQGLATPLVAAGYLLARNTHAPNLYFASAIGQSICKEGAPLGLQSPEALWIDQALTVFGFVQAAADLLPQVKPKEFFRPGQVDPRGNFNNIAFGESHSRPRLRMPGTGGIPDVTTILPETFLYVPRHSRVTFVKKLDFLSGLGHNPSRIRDGGPVYLVSDLGQFDFWQGRMRLSHIHPGVEVARVKAKTGFDLRIADPLEITRPPSPVELELLRNQIDPHGVRKIELLGGKKRREAIREILRKEKIEKI